MTPAERKREIRKRNLAIAAVLLALVALIFVVTLVQLGANVANRPF
jgi:hypothetical protein